MSEKKPTFAIQDLRLMRTGLLRGYSDRLFQQMKVLARGGKETDEEYGKLYHHYQELKSEMRKRGL